jgi:prepilin-type N-terminal cleavage/methylation domain-containing protein
MKLRRSPQGFTLIELLVVISIIAVLASIAVPTFAGVIEKGNQTKVLNNAKQIYLALKLYAGDNDGIFPASFAATTSGNATTTQPTDANDAFRNIVPAYLSTEQPFYVPKSAYTPSKPDDDTSTGKALAAGENHFAYVSGLSDTSNSRFPIIADGFSSTVGDYSTSETAKGGVWKGKAAIVVRVDGSGKVERTVVSDKKSKVQEKLGAQTISIFDQATDWLETNQKAVNPL